MSESSPPLQENLGRGLRRQLAMLRARLVQMEVLRRGAVTLSVAIVGLALFLGIDWLADLPMDARTAFLIGLVSAGALLFLWTLAAFVTMRRDDEPLALMVEEERRGFRSRLIASVQFSRGKASVPDATAAAMVRRLLEDTESYAKGVRFTEVINARPLKRALLACVLLGGLAAAGYVAGGGITRVLLKRAFLSDEPVPRATRVNWMSGYGRIGIGDSVTLDVLVDGYEPERGTLRIRYESGRKRKVPMTPVEGEPGRYSTTLENVQESFTCMAAVNDGRTEWREIQALPRPVVMELSGRQTYPAYTKLPPSDHKPGEFLLFPGSELDLTITASQPLQSGTVRLLGRGGVVATKVDAEDPRLLHARFIAPDGDLTGFTLELLDTENMASQDATVYRIDILADEPPKVRIVRPSRQRELVTPSARVLVGYEAEDRFGIDRLVLHYQVNEGEESRVDLPIAEQGTKLVAEEFDWDLAELAPGLQIGDEVKFWVEGHDQNANTEVGKSAVRVLVVVTPREKRDDLLSRVGDHLGRVEQATGNQERLNAMLADWIRAQAPIQTGQPPADNDSNNGNE